MGEGTIRKSYWLSAEDLDLGGRWKIEWDCYIKGLTEGGIKLSDHMDKLVGDIYHHTHSFWSNWPS